MGSMVYRTSPFSRTVNDPIPRFQSQAILWRSVSPKWLKVRPWLLHRVSPLMFDNNFGKCGPIFNILSPIKLDVQGWVSSWTSPLNPRPCHVGRPQDEAAQGMHKVRWFVRYITKISTSPAICCYTTLWNSKILKCYQIFTLNVTINMFN